MFDFLSNPTKDGLKLMQERRYAEAIAFFTQLLAKKPKLAEAHLNLGKCFFIQERYPEAKIHLLKALELKKTNDIIQGILEVTNWKMLAPSKYFNSSPRFSPDGKQVVYVSARKGVDEGAVVTQLDNGGIYICDIETGKERCVVPDSYNNSLPIFSPNGKKLIYISARPKEGESSSDDNPALYIMDLDTGNEKMLLDESYKIKHPIFSPDSKKLIFGCWRRGEKNSAIYSLEINTGKMDILIMGNYENTFPSISIQGDKLIFSSWRRDTNGDGSIDIRDNSGLYMKDIVNNVEFVIAKDDYNNSFPSFSPDGNKVVYLSVRRDTNGDGKIDTFDNPGIYIYDHNERKEYCIVNDDYFCKFPSFAMFGQKIVFVSNLRSPTEYHMIRGYFEFKGIYLVDIKKRNITKILSELCYGTRSLVVSPMGDKVAYVSWHHDTARGLYVAYLDRLPTPDEAKQFIERNI